MSTAARPKNLAIYAILRPRQSRSKNGCLSCRARRKKCGEQRPVCRLCEKLKMRCVWPDFPSNENPDTGSMVPAKLEGVQPMQGAISTQTQGRRQRTIQGGASGNELPSNPNRLVEVLSNGEKQSDEIEVPLLQVTQLRVLERYLCRPGILSECGKPSLGPSHSILINGGLEAGMLFDHFLYKTVPWLINSNRHGNLILKHIVPLASANTLVLHTVLAISGIHLQHFIPSVKTSALTHYTSALRQLKQGLSDWSNCRGKEYRVLLTTIILLCYCEYIDGNTSGAGLQHVRASREFVDIALEHLHDPDHQELVVLLVESYGYFALVANLRGSTHEEDIKLGLEFSSSIMPMIQDLPSFGAMFAFEPEGLSLVPTIAYLSWYRQQGLSADQQFLAVHGTLQNSMVHRQAANDTMSLESVDHTLLDGTQLILNIKTNTLLIFLHATFYQHHGSLAIDIAAFLQPLINTTMTLLARVQPTDAGYCGLFWCFMVMGSFLRDRDRQESLARQLEAIQSQMPFQKRGVELLRWLWEDPDSAECGLLGLEKVATAHGVGLCIC